MASYEKPVLGNVNETMEGIYEASGGTTPPPPTPWTVRLMYGGFDGGSLTVIRFFIKNNTGERYQGEKSVEFSSKLFLYNIAKVQVGDAEHPTNVNGIELVGDTWTTESFILKVKGDIYGPANWNPGEEVERSFTIWMVNSDPRFGGMSGIEPPGTCDYSLPVKISAKVIQN